MIAVMIVGGDLMKGSYKFVILLGLFVALSSSEARSQLGTRNGDQRKQYWPINIDCHTTTNASIHIFFVEEMHEPEQWIIEGFPCVNIQSTTADRTFIGKVSFGGEPYGEIVITFNYDLGEWKEYIVVY